MTEPFCINHLQRAAPCVSLCSLRRRWADAWKCTFFNWTFLNKTFSYLHTRWSSSVEAEGGEGLLALAGEISDQLTVADHQKQAAACTHNNVQWWKDWADESECSKWFFFLPKASHHCQTMGNSSITARQKKKTCIVGTVSSVRASVGLLLTQAGDRYVHERDGEGVVPHPPLHHRSEQKTTAEVGELQGHEVHWGRPTQQET